MKIVLLMLSTCLFPLTTVSGQKIDPNNPDPAKWQLIDYQKRTAEPSDDPYTTMARRGVQPIDTYFLRKDSIVKAGPFIRFWLREQMLLSDDTFEPDYELVSFKADCAKHAAGVQVRYSYDAKGEATANLKANPVTTIPPDTVLEFVVEKVCSMSKNQK